MSFWVKTKEAKNGFYPTPPELADKLLGGIDWTKIQYVLEPSAGTGNLVHRVGQGVSVSYRRDERIDVDCIEIDPHLRAILKDRFSEQSVNLLYRRIQELEKKERSWDSKTRRYQDERTPDETLEHNTLKFEKGCLYAVDLHIVHDDFLTFQSRKKYDLIVLNPPFADGDAHLLKALMLQETHGGEIRCILNAETIRNPYSNRRQMLVHKLNDLGATITFHKHAFMQAERPTEVEIAIIAVSVPAPAFDEDEFSLWNRMKKAHSYKENEYETKDLTVGDFFDRMVRMYDLECDSGIALIHEYWAMKPYILDSMDKDDRYSSPTIELRVGDKSAGINRYLKLVRRKYWRALLLDDRITKGMTSNLTQKYQHMVEKLTNYDFTLFNIQALVAEMNAEMVKGVEDTIYDLFETMSDAHTWYPECQKNKHYYSGWATNKAHKVGMKVILPVRCDLFYDYKSNDGVFRTYNAVRILADIEKTLSYLDGNRTELLNLQWILENASKAGQTKDICCNFFSVSFYKKGTMHLKFFSQDIIDRFNIFASQRKGWLPPYYGKVSYENMEDEAKAVIDSFHGNGSPGSGKAAYGEVLARSDYFLAPVSQSMQALPAAQTA